MTFNGWPALHERVNSASTFDDVRSALIDARAETMRELAHMQEQIEADVKRAGDQKQARDSPYTLARI